MSPFEYLQLAISAALFLAAIYAVRSLRIIGRKASEIIFALRRMDKDLTNQIQDLQGSLQTLHAAALFDFPRKKSNLKYVLSFTSHPARFTALEQLIPSITSQILEPSEIYLNIAKEHLPLLSRDLAKKLKSAGIIVNPVNDLGPGKKLIPTLTSTKLPIICIDDDLVLPADLTLQLMLQHRLYPNSIIASRTHRITTDSTGSIRPFKEWELQFSKSAGPEPELLATSGAGTLFPLGSLHTDATNEKLYIDLAFHTDDLWWYFQARRIGTNVRRIPGRRALNFIEGTQADGLWSTGNKGRNEENLLKLIAKYGNPLSA
jgi:hypothetical protein